MVTSRLARWDSLDVLRVIAVFLMVQGHTFDVVLSDTVRAESWFRWHRYVHGFTAPLFLFASGTAFGVTTFRRWSAHTVWGPAVRKRLFRYSLLIVIGYALHMMGYTLSGILRETAEKQRHLFLVDALQHIGVVLLLAEMAVLATRRRGLFVALILTLTLLSVGFAPWVWRQDFGNIPLVLAAYLNDETGSIFPILPWSGFILAGIVTAHFATDRQGGLRRVSWLGLLVVGFLIYQAGVSLTASEFQPFGEHDYWKTGPWFFLLRLGIVMGALGLLGGLRALRRGSAVPNWLRTIATETLAIYVLHLVILYGSPLLRGVRRIFSRDLSVTSSSMVTLGVLTLSLAIGFGWHYAKKKWPRQVDRTRDLILVVGALVFLFG
jgi:surface polysaccharide O-acyltransferase-like enzyme